MSVESLTPELSKTFDTLCRYLVADSRKPETLVYGGGNTSRFYLGKHAHVYLKNLDLSPIALKNRVPFHGQVAHHQLKDTTVAALIKKDKRRLETKRYQPLEWSKTQVTKNRKALKEKAYSVFTPDDMRLIETTSGLTHYIENEATSPYSIQDNQQLLAVGEMGLIKQPATWYIPADNTDPLYLHARDWWWVISPLINPYI